MYNLDQRAKRYSQKPSEILGVRTPIVAFWFDEAVAFWGAWVEAKLSERDEKGKPKHDLDKLLGVRQYATYSRE